MSGDGGSLADRPAREQRKQGDSGGGATPQLSLRGRILLVAFSLAVPLAMLLLAEAVTRHLPSTQKALGLPRGSVARWRSAEFDVMARANSLGLRGPETSIEPTRDHRILALGDSFTFGWGVELEETWIRLLEGALVRDGFDVEVLNMGEPGASPWRYADFAERAVPVLKPDLVIVAVLQGDDIAQLRLGQWRPRGPVWRLFQWFLPETLADMARRATRGTVDIAASWREQVEEVQRSLERNDAERAIFERTSPEVQRMFLAGELNPPLISIATQHPEYWRWTLRLDDPEIRTAIDELTDSLRRIRTVTGENGGSVLVLAVPLGAFVSAAKHARYIETGFVLEPSDLQASEMDEAIRMAAERAGLPFHSVTRGFREASEKLPLYFPYDGHFDRSGNRLFATSIHEVVAEQLRQGATGRQPGDR
jgi:hypothetical protein